MMSKPKRCPCASAWRMKRPVNESEGLGDMCVYLHSHPFITLTQPESSRMPKDLSTQRNRGTEKGNVGPIQHRRRCPRSTLFSLLLCFFYEAAVRCQAPLIALLRIHHHRSNHLACPPFTHPRGLTLL